MFPLAVMQIHPPPPLVHLRPKFSHPSDLGCPNSEETPSPKENINERWHYYMLSGPIFRSAFVFTINSLALSGFPLTSYHLAEAWLSAFSWLWTLVLQLSENITKCLLFIIIHIFSIHFAMNLVLFIHLENVNKLWNNNRTVHVNKRNQNKPKLGICVSQPQALPWPPAPTLAPGLSPGLRPQFVFNGPSPNLYLQVLAS